MKIKGQYNQAIVLADSIEDTAYQQIQQLVNQPFSKKSNIVVMSDVHSGTGSVIGLTMTIKDKVVPSLVGVDIGCGMEVINLGKEYIDFHSLDDFINRNIPSGFSVNNEIIEEFPLDGLKCFSQLRDINYLTRSLGSLGGGNHFIEIDVDNEGNHYLIIHSGSRSLGVQVCDIYQKVAVNHTFNQIFNYQLEAQKIIDYCVSHNQENLINNRLQDLKKLAKNIVYPNRDLCYLEGQDFENYLYDMGIVQKFAARNRQLIAEKIVKFLNCAIVDRFTCIHNYIDLEDKILRKGSIDASLGKRVIIPLNMRDGCILGIGKGNKKYNSSAPHGAGRAISRMNAKDKISLIDFKEEMKNIYSTSVGETTIDEAPQAYKNKNDILKYLPLLVDDIRIIKPLYNFKAH